MSMNEFLLIAGLLLNLLGSLLVAYSVKKNPGGAHQMLENGERIYLAVIDYKKFKWGIFLLIFGFVSQLLGVFWVPVPNVDVVAWGNMSNIEMFYWGLAVLSSLFVTYFAPQIHGLKSWGELPWPLLISQWILNLLGSMVGWIALAYFLFWRLHSGATLDLTDFIVLVVAFYGITGYLPYILMQKGLPWKA